MKNYLENLKASLITALCVIIAFSKNTVATPLGILKLPVSISVIGFAQISFKLFQLSLVVS